MAKVRPAAISGLAPLAGAGLLLLAAAFPALAHRAGPAGPIEGIEIPGVSHGQMAVIARHRGEILALASRQAETDRTFRRILNFGSLQFGYCLWGMVPGSLTDEESPFNACSHAYLAAARALLVHMEQMPQARAEAAALVSRIDADMVRSGASWVTCRHSEEPFDTGRIVTPRWSEFPSHGASLATFGTFGVASFAGLAFVFGRGRPTGKSAA